MKHNFNESDYDYSFGTKIPVTVLPKYISTKKKIIPLIEGRNFNLTDEDFWILKNYNKDKTKCFYSGLIITHEALVRINDLLPHDQKFNQNFCSDPIPTEWKGIKGYRMEYRDKIDGMFEYGEISEINCKNDYPFAMLLKRTFDRVVKRKAKLYMVYSDSEAEEFRYTETKKEPLATDEQVTLILMNKDVIMDELMAREINNKEKVEQLSIKEASYLCRLIEERING